MYEGIKIATGPSTIKTAPLKSKSGETITDQRKQLGRWLEHYLELYATQSMTKQHRKIKPKARWWWLYNGGPASHPHSSSSSPLLPHVHAQGYENNWRLYLNYWLW